MIYDTVEAWKIFQAIKAHFTSKNYDYFKYGGRLKNTGWEYFSKNKSKKLFKVYATKYASNYKLFLACCFLTNPKISWIGECGGDECKETFTRSNNYIQSASRSFEKDLDTMIAVAENNNVSLGSLFRSTDNDVPPLEKMRIQCLTNTETSVILHRLTGWIEKVDAPINPIWDENKRVLLKYSPFVNVDIPKCKNILKHKLETLNKQ